MYWGKRLAYGVKIIFLVSALFLLSSCVGSNEDAAGKAVETYLQALVAEDADRLATLSCAAWEEQAVMEVDAFVGVSASLSNVECTQTGTENGDALVSCSGEILATYNNEQQSLPLEGLVYRVVQENGEWLVCGYQ